MKRERKSFLHRHSLSLTGSGVAVALILLYSHSDPNTHLGSFYGNAIADRTGLLVMVLATKHLMTKRLMEASSKESK
jgi:hypothetical protein